MSAIPSSEPLSLLQPDTITEFWDETIQFANELEDLKPIYLYYWSPEDQAVIANRCEIGFEPTTGIQFSFYNPLHRGPGSSTKTGELKYSGRLRKVGDIISFEVFSDERKPEPASGIAYPGVLATSGIVARGNMVGFQTRGEHGPQIVLFRFILLSDPHPRTKLQKTDRIPKQDAIKEEPLRTYFEDELRGTDG